MKILILEGLHGKNTGKKMQWRLKRTNLKVGDRVVLDCHDWKIIKVVEEKKKRPDEFMEFAKFYNLSGNTLISPRLFYNLYEKWEKDKKVSSILEQKFLQEKEVRRAKKEQVKRLMKMVINREDLIKLHNRPYFKTIVTEVKGKPSKGENLEKIKFPCFCSFKTAQYDYRSFGELDLIVCRDFEFYRIRELKQVDRKMVYGHQFIKTYLKDIIEWFEVEILKGEIYLWREVG